VRLLTISKNERKKQLDHVGFCDLLWKKNQGKRGKFWGFEYRDLTVAKKERT